MKRDFKSLITYRSITVLVIIFVFIPTFGFILYFVESSAKPRSAEASNDSTNVLSSDIENYTDESSVFENVIEPLHFEPRKLVAESIDVDINLVKLGIDEEGRLDVPENWNEGGWYQYGPKTGEDGNVIIAAHYDTSMGSPAAFWRLKNTQVNDTVSVVDEYGRYYDYQVVDVFYVDIEDPNRIQVLEDTEDPTLTLITCGGVWNYSKGTYDKRLVVKAKLV